MMTVFKIRLRPERVEALRQVARRKSYQQRRNVTWSQLVRDAIEVVLVTANVEDGRRMLEHARS